MIGRLSSSNCNSVQKHVTDALRLLSRPPESQWSGSRGPAAKKDQLLTSH
ncbi:hypothetical protein DAPPUDRAFT_236255 [Daphnia pulex]|uniref:Uncharacterized protein n=1 Tax=Daphnia pulex TaxID=6669 RepID=E9G1L3_DAPPU|nr:hypothetical protein DAPPUDRAFT_236255 [Daphnia pulex]|eukprot:EFX86516.1 hypothetical protein DAPPUDRAFT_236255 [Daphnia pulex]